MKHLLLLFICTVSLTVWGQETVPYTQTFNDAGLLPTGWTTVDNNAALHDPDQVWTVGTIEYEVLGWDQIPNLDGNYANLNSYEFGDGESQNADLISPSFNLSGTSTQLILEFDHFFYYYWEPVGNMATLYYRLNDGSWSDINTWYSSSSNGETFSYIIPVSETDTKIQFKWNYVGSYCYGWAVDNFSLRELTTTTWIGGSGPYWDNASNWSNGVPDGSKEVIISGLTSPIIRYNAECNNLSILNTLDPLFISPGATLTVYNVLANDEVEGIVIQADETASGSLIAGSRSGTGTEKIEVYLDIAGDGWHDVSSPVDQTIENFLTVNDNEIIPEKTGGIRGMVTYNEGEDKWDDFFTNATTGNLEDSKGYLLRRTSPGVVVFNGIIRTGEQNIDISADGFGWNLIGNPYSSAIYANLSADPNNFLTYNLSSLHPSYQAVYIWDGSAPYYEIINHAAGADYIGVGQGFFVKTDQNTTADFTPAMQVHQPTIILKSETVIPEIKLAVSNGKKSFSTSIKFFKDATLGLDRGYDAGIFKADKTFSIFTRLIEDNDLEFGLQCLPFPKSDGMIIPVGIDCKAGGDVTISLSATTVPANYDLVLEDRLLNKFIPFNEANSFYNASLAAETKGIGRFYLHVKSAQTTGIDNPTNAKINAWMDRDEIVVKGVTENNAVAKLFDARGSVILMKNLENTNTNRIKVNGINTGIYMLQVIENGKRTTSKLQISGN